MPFHRAVPAALLGRDGFFEVLVTTPPPAVFYFQDWTPGRQPARRRRFVLDPRLEPQPCYVEVTHSDGH
jgi:hypothetical protein